MGLPSGTGGWSEQRLDRWPLRTFRLYLARMINSGGSNGAGSVETAIPMDTAPEAWEVQIAALKRLGPAGRVAAAVDLSESIRATQIAGIKALHPQWSRADVVRHLVSMHYGIDLPRGR
jgi:hypothetical protein